MAQFLVTARYTEPGPLLPPDAVVQMIESVIIPSLQQLADWEHNGAISGGVFAGERAGSFVLNAGSSEEAGALLAGLPFWGVLTWDVKPLQSFASTVARERAVVERISAAISA
jgi:hypothetical protein